MAIVNFVPKIWSANILSNLRSKLVYAGPGISNRDYEGEIAQAGDTVHIVSFTDPAVRAYTKSTDITYDLLTDADRTLVVNQSDYFAFTVDDIDRRQALPGFIAKASQGAAYNLVKNVDTYVATALLNAVNGTGNDVGPVSVTVAAADAYAKIFVAMRTKLNRAAVPMEGRWAVVPPELYGYLLQDSRFVTANASADGGRALHEGFVGRIAGFDIYESNTTPQSGSAYHIIAGTPIANTFADQISETEAIRLEKQFGDGVRGLHLYGTKVVYPAALALATATLA
jgi:P22 coat protein - gene protein 5